MKTTVDSHLVQKLYKLLMLTTSNNDPEALLAIRKANAMLKTQNKCWQDFSLTVSTKTKTPPPSENEGVDAESYDMIEFILRYRWPNFDSSFVEDLLSKLDDGKDLSDAQYNALCRVHAAVRKHAGKTTRQD